ncbi:MAG: UDP-N-acetylmuramate dehydrogenase [Candidatus Parcubacteria bacterium]|nr:UDP-N-acetylmuramate dehydrogenase [Candidatus Parcubacteria bacterium]
MEICENYDLKNLNTFGVSVNTQFFVELHSEQEVSELFNSPEFKKNQKIFLGGGSNVLFTKDFDGIVVLNKLKGIEIVGQDEKIVTVRALGGEVWHDLVEFAVERNYWGIENLALIPGTVGATPIQNVGAYGVELKDTLLNVEAFEIETGKKRIFSKEECNFGYRDSIFKNELKGKYFISAIVLKLSKIENKNINYKILQDYLTENKIEIQSSRDISDAVANIRRSRLPDPVVLGNAGSFFKNVLVPLPRLRELLQAYPDLPYFEEEELIKIPAGWLIEQAGPANGTSWKGYRVGNVGVHEKQALVLVNYGGASGEEVLDLAYKIIDSVKEKFGVKLVPEVNIV